jgi:hypothetical protein
MYTDLFGHELRDAEAGRKGRNPELNEARNIALIHRYYYYAKLRKLRYDLVLLELEREFFLSTDTIPRVVDDYHSDIKRLMNEGVGCAELREKYPWLVWDL